jgi:O-antigen ligase/tetratricopeptide (TPR) repeat protein
VRLAVWLGIAVLAIYVTFIGGTYFGQNQIWRVVSTVAAAVVLAAWLGAAFTRLGWRPRSAIWPAIVACLAAFVISSALSWDPRISFEMTAYAVLLAGLYLLAVRLMAEPFFALRLGSLAFALCSLICAAYLVRVAMEWVEWWGLVGRVAVPPLRPAYEGLTYQTPNAVATVTVLLYAVAAAHLGWLARAHRVAVGLLGIAVVAVVIITASRGAWAAVAASIVVLAVVWLARQENRAAIRRRLADRRVAAITAAAVVVVAVFGLVLLPRLLSRFATGGGELRLGFIASALRMFAERPLTGSGPGTWVIRRAAFTRPGEIDLYVPHAHDIYAQTLAEFGLLGAGAGALLIGGILWLVWAGLRGTDPVRRRFALATLFAVVFLGVQQVVDFFGNLPAALLPLALLVAALDAGSERSFVPGRLRLERLTGRSLPSLVPATALLVATVLAVLTLGSSEATAGKQEAALAASEAGDRAGALSLAEAAAAADPTIGAYQLTLALIAAGERTPTPEDARALVALRASAERDQLSESWLDLAALRVDAGDQAGAEQALDSALRLGAQRASVNFPAGSLWLRLGHRVFAIDAFSTAVSQAPSIAADPYWSSTPELSEVSTSVVEGAMSRAIPVSAWEIALMAGDPSEPARRTALDPPEREIADLVTPAWAGDAGARAALVRVAVDDPLDAFAVGWSARLAARAGDAAQASRFRQWLVTVDPVVAAGAAYDRRIDNGGLTQVAPADDPAAAYGPATYRRPTPPELVLERLPRVVLAP